MHLTGQFEVPDLDPARLTASEWQSMRQEAGELEPVWQETYQALIEAAHAEPALRALYPFTSHWPLRLSITTRPSLTVVGPCLMANSACVVEAHGPVVYLGHCATGVDDERADAEWEASVLRPGRVTLSAVQTANRDLM
ncbi:DUF6193 family natural product biosynthesis protein [Streptomyces decoyicus]|uniref:DUF6193 family natural product biosynthesis protein n=1 Tax=Streptomyces decoyicus TaxID=249567 RepID=UPI00380D0CA4